ncbi:MAG: M48 family metallopeptidase, partial [Candidatus Colwellbacteria bacterium]|nr:M48 family metallopeptidase [Candidatus Colwellbacteria bacterium]
MATLYTQKDTNIRKTWALVILFMCIVIGFGWVLSSVYHSPNILYIAVIVSTAMSIVSYWFSDKIVIAMSGGKEVTMQNYPELYRIVENLSITAGLPMPKVYIVPEMAPNAFATGRSPDHSAVAVTAGLLEVLDRSELEGVLAHELSHIGNRDMLLGTVIVVLVGFISILSDIFLRMGISSRDRDEDRRDGLMMILGIVFAILAPIAATLIQLAISRKREFLADASGALLTRYPEGLANALLKISGDKTEMKSASNATAHLWLANPFKGSMKGMSKLFMT